MRGKLTKGLIFIFIIGVFVICYEGRKTILLTHGYDTTLKTRSRQNTDFIEKGLPREAPASNVTSDVIHNARTLTSQRKGFISEECRIVLNGDMNRMEEWRNSSNEYFPRRDITTDDDVIKMASNCTNLKLRYQFPGSEFIVTDEELNFPLAYSILAHENINQILVLLSAIYREHNIHCIHLDAKSSPKVYETLVEVTKCFSNVFISTVRQRVVYAHVTRLLADIACMKDLVALPKTLYKWKYLINLCSQDFPLRTNRETVEQLKVFRGKNSIGGYRKIDDLIKERTEFVYEIRNETSKDGSTEEKVVKTKKGHSPPPFNLTVVKNLAYNLYSRDFLQWALVDSQVGPALLRWSMDTYSPDEHFWLMLHSYAGAPGGSQLASGYQLARQIKWWFTNDEKSCHGKWRHYICIFGAEDIHDLTKSRTLFVNKLDVTLDSTGSTCLRQWLNERTLIPNDMRKETNPDQQPNIPPQLFYS